MKRSSVNKKDRSGPPPGLSKYARKQATQRKEAQQAAKVSSEASVPSPAWPAPPEPEKITGKICGIYLKTQGHIILQDRKRRNIKVSDTVLRTYDRAYVVRNGMLVECTALLQSDGLRAIRVHKITALVR